MRSTVPGPDDTRGIVDPAFMRTIVSLERYPPGEALDGLVDWFWAVAYELPEGMEHVQKVLTHPGSHLSVGTVDRAGRVMKPAGARVYGVHRRLDQRRLVGDGWTVAAKTSGGLGALTDRPAHTLTDAEVPMDDALGVRGVAALVEGAGDEAARVAALRGVLERVVARRPAPLLALAREVTAVAAVAEHDRSVVRVEQLAAHAGVGVRTLQRMFSQALGVSPAWVIRRWRIVEAADRAAGGDDVVWAELAADLGYADQAHLVRDFRSHLGTTPAAYTRSLTTV
ncbi:MAG: helix-turn-helix transcriptional regulator [Actinobacteria bacterium]|nr:helix-turn-helix transcriptional regulator [Actinomycetota bacterium]